MSDSIRIELIRIEQRLIRDGHIDYGPKRASIIQLIEYARDLRDALEAVGIWRLP